MKNSNDTIGNRTRDLRLVAQCLNQLRYGVTPGVRKYINNCIENLSSTVEQDASRKEITLHNVTTATRVHLSCPWALQLYRTQSPHSPEHPMTAAALRNAIKRDILYNDGTGTILT